MTNGKTEYVEVEANSGAMLYAIPSDHETMNGYYIKYQIPENPGDNAGFTGAEWYLNEQGNPLTAAGHTTEKDIIDSYIGQGGNLTFEFKNWKSNLMKKMSEQAADIAINEFINHLLYNAYDCVEGII